MNLKIKALWSSQQRHNWQQLRTPLLALTFVGVACVVAKTIVSPIKTGSELTPFAFPQEIPLAGWQLSQSRALADPATLDKHATTLSGRSYQYTHNQLPLDIKMRYVVVQVGDVKNLVRDYTSIKLPNALFHQRQQDGVGFHNLFAYQGRAYLSACINPGGGSSVTHRQFVQNQLPHMLRFEHLLPVLSGQASLQDKRCLWTHLSLPLKNASSEEAYDTLEQAWVSWYRWWKPNFPRF